MKSRALIGIYLWLAVIARSGSLQSDEPTDVDFRRDIRPLLSDRCFHCHGPDETTRMADLRLDQHQSAIQVLGGGDPGASELLRRALSKDPEEVMPPPETNKPLTKKEIELLRTWVAEGAPWSGHWAYEPPKRWALPQPTSPDGASHSDWPNNWIDQFLLTAMQEHQLVPSPDADRVTLLRRLSFDLTGLPPSQSILDSKLENEEDYQKIVEQLLESPQYGERLAMYWLDLVRYADTVGYHGDQDHSISPYRDWVIDAFNAGMPFDQMTREQLAGDLAQQPTLSQRIASGYNRLLQTTHEGGLQPGEYRAIYAADRVRNVSNVWLGATVGCAQCHDHKFDPFTMSDFYSLAAFFADVDDESHFTAGSNELPTRRDPEIELPTDEQVQQLNLLQQELLEIDQQIAAGKLSPEENQKSQERKKAAESARKEIQTQVRRSMITVALAKPRTTRILPRGNWMDESGPEVQPAYPGFLTRAACVQGAESAVSHSTGRRLTRLDLANWLTDSDQGIGLLTARVMANRLWYLFFGSGLSRDLSDFGSQGQSPSHPELLDNLAYHLVDHGWELRSTIRLIVSSRAYRQSSNVTVEGRQRDPANRWFARQAAYRLPAEMIRDNALEISGLLVRSLGGKGARPYQPEDYYKHLNFPIRTYIADSDQNQWRRGVYVHWQRQFLHPMLRAFDATNREECTAERTRSNTPLAALTLLNDPTFVEAARALAEKALDPANVESVRDDRQRISWIFQRATSHQPSEQQVDVLLELLKLNRNAFLAEPDSAQALLNTGIRPLSSESVESVSVSSELAAWSEVCRAVMNLAETSMRF